MSAGKICAILVQRGHQVSTEYVSHLMLEMGLFSIRATAKQDYMKLHEPEKKRNLLRQQFQADRPNQIWVSDVTCFKLVEFYLYTCVILDLFSRKVVAYKVPRKTSTHLITSTFKAAWEQCAPDAGLIFHSDRGAQYTLHWFRQLLHERTVVQSFSNSGKLHDNAVAESFFATLELFFAIAIIGSYTKEVEPMPYTYPLEFKIKAIRRYEKGESIQSLCQELHIAQSTLYHWRKQFCSIMTPQRSYTPKEFDAVSRQLQRL